jgi:hypothetical protein
VIIALDTEHEWARLPVVADDATSKTAARVILLGADEPRRVRRVDEDFIAVSPTTAALNTDIETTLVPAFLCR